MIAAIIIFFRPDWHIADPICTFIFAILCLFTTIPIFKDCAIILMEAALSNIEVDKLFKEILAVKISIKLKNNIHENRAQTNEELLIGAVGLPIHWLRYADRSKDI